VQIAKIAAEPLSCFVPMVAKNLDVFTKGRVFQIISWQTETSKFETSSLNCFEFLKKIQGISGAGISALHTGSWNLAKRVPFGKKRTGWQKAFSLAKSVPFCKKRSAVWRRAFSLAKSVPCFEKSERILGFFRFTFHSRSPTQATMTIAFLLAPTARTSTTSTAARAVLSRSCLISTKVVTRSTSTSTFAASGPSTCSAGRRTRGLVTTTLGLLGGGVSSFVHPVVVTLCEKKKSNDDILSRDENGNIDWKAVLDNVATMTGEKVCHMHVLGS
jgi:hypothetical protein